MIYTYTNTNIIPKDLLLLFNYYQDDILTNLSNYQNNLVQDLSSEYIIKSIMMNNIVEKNFLIRQILLMFKYIKKLLLIEDFSQKYVQIVTTIHLLALLHFLH